MGINISSNYIPAININTGISVSGTLSVSTNSFYNVTNYQTINITKLEDFLETRLNTPLQVTSYNNDNLTYIAPYTFYNTGIISANFSACTSIGGSAFQSCHSLASISFPNCKSIGGYAFASCSSLTTANFPSCTSIGGSVFRNCSALISANFPFCTYISNYAFYNCNKLTSISFPICTTIGGSAFRGCSSLTTVSFPACTSINYAAFEYCRSLTTANFLTCTTIDSSAFATCYNLLSLYLLGSSLCSLANANAFNSTPIAGYTTSTGGVYGSIYVPASLYNSYITATN